MSENIYKVKLQSGDKKIIFDVSPSSLSESRGANYDQWNLVHLPTDLYAYRNTSSRSWEVQAVLVSRSGKEAVKNSKILNTVRFWVLPDFAKTGAPPPILRFSAYGDPNIEKVTCILRNYSWNYPSDVDYVFADDKSPVDHKMPIIGTLSLSLLEIYSAKQIQERAWEIKMEKAKPTPVGGKGKSSPLDDFNFPKNPSDFLPDIPTIPDVTGDLTNFLKETTIPSFTEIVKDSTSNLPSLPIPSLPDGFGNGFGT